MHIDEDFIAAATAEMQEAMNMSPAEFEAAAEQLLLAEKGGAFRLVQRVIATRIRNPCFLQAGSAGHNNPLTYPCFLQAGSAGGHSNPLT